MLDLPPGRIRPPRVRNRPFAFRIPLVSSAMISASGQSSDLLRLGYGRFTVDWVNSISESERQFVQQNNGNFAYLFNRDAS